MAVIDVAGLPLLDIAEEGFAPCVGIIGLVCLAIKGCMTDEDIHIGEFAELFCGPKVVPLVRA